MSKRVKTSYTGVYYRVVDRIGGTGQDTEKVYYILFKKDGRTHEEKIGYQFRNNMTPAKASRIRSLRIEGNIQSRKEVREQAKREKREQDNIYTLDRLFDVFCEGKQHLKSLRDDKYRYNLHLKVTLGDKTVEELSPFDVQRIIVKLKKNHKAQTVRHVVTLLKRIVNYGYSLQLCQPIPFKLESIAVDNVKTETLSPEQLQALLTAINSDPDIQAQNFMKLALFTGMRRGELFRLQWSDIDFRGFINIRDPKGGKSTTIPLNDQAKNILENHPRTDSPYVFPGRNGQQRTDIKRPVNRIRERANLPKDFRPLHGLRHVYASMLASSGQVDMYTLQKLLTHKSPQMTQRYAHLRDQTLRAASNLMGDLVNEAITSKPQNVINFQDHKQ